MLFLHPLDAELIDLIENVEEIALCVDPCPINGRNDFAADFLAGGGDPHILRFPEGRQELAFHKTHEPAESSHLKLGSFLPRRCRPISSTIGIISRRHKRCPDGFCLLRFFLLSFIEDMKKKHSSQLQHILKRAGSPRPPHNVTVLLTWEFAAWGVVNLRCLFLFIGSFFNQPFP